MRLCISVLCVPFYFFYDSILALSEQEDLR